MLTLRLTVLLLALLLGSHRVWAEEIRGQVVGITDGDTITLRVPSHPEIKVRLAEIDAPEKGQAFGTQSRKILSSLVFGRAVLVDVSSQDRYGRSIGRVYVESPAVDVSAAMVEAGAAWVFDRYAKDPILYELQQDARQNRRGLWALPPSDQTPPWEWRRASRH